MATHNYLSHQIQQGSYALLRSQKASAYMAYKCIHSGLDTYSQIKIINQTNKTLFEKVNKHTKKRKYQKGEQNKTKTSTKIPKKQCISDVPQLQI